MMSAFSLILLVIGIIYGGLTALAGIIQLKQRKVKRWSSLSMILGGISVIILVISKFEPYNIYMLIAALLLIHIVAIDNGINMYGKIKPKHHIIRLCISVLIIILYLIK
jgi:hypothetical protein